MNVRIKRVYDNPAEGDGTRILVDRLWPRGLTKERAAVDVWLKEIAPTTELRKWYGHDLMRWDEFRARYLVELRANRNALDRLKELIDSGPVTLLYAARDELHNEAVILRDHADTLV